MRCLLVGSGHIGRRHARALRTLAPGTEVVALRSGRGGALPDGVADREVHAFADALALRPDCAIVADPAPCHPASAAPLLAKGIPTLVEKPLAADAAGADALRAAAAAPDRVLIGYLLRHDEALTRFRAALASGEVGGLVSLHLEAGGALAGWRPGMAPERQISARPETGGGVLFELSHEIDAARWLLGEIVESHVIADRRGTPRLAVEDAAILLLRCQGGPVSVQIDMARARSTRRYRAVGTRGTLVWTAEDGTLRLEEPGGIRTLHDRTPEPDERLRRQMAHFLAVVRGEAASLCTLDDGIAALKAVLDLRRKAGLDAGVAA
ncbi:MAG: Gfo/Idh/MocA family oxidoreductase [Alphaproteobacteria bacterium]|nr:Gfo/Idh/MocA family oxidoreductase [Alphaproteobacteria bacterium]